MSVDHGEGVECVCVAGGQALQTGRVKRGRKLGSCRILPVGLGCEIWDEEGCLWVRVLGRTSGGLGPQAGREQVGPGGT